MDEIGTSLKNAREKIGVSLEEVSQDINIKELMLKNIEDGNIGCFKDIFLLKEYIKSYAKYLGLDGEELLKLFNEYIFEYTSKIPVKEIEKAVEQKEKENKKLDDTVVSPYTFPSTKEKRWYILVGFIVLIVVVICALIWSVKQIVINNTNTTNKIVYKD